MFLATLVIGLSTGIVDYWTKGINYYLDSGYQNKISAYAFDEEISLTKEKPATLPVGTLTLLSVEKKEEVTEVTIELKSEISYGGGKVIAAKALSGTKTVRMKVSFSGRELTFSSQKVEKDKVFAVYTYSGDIPDEAKFTVSDVILNEFSRE